MMEMFTQIIKISFKVMEILLQIMETLTLPTTTMRGRGCGNKYRMEI